MTLQPEKNSSARRIEMQDWHELGRYHLLVGALLAVLLLWLAGAQGCIKSAQVQPPAAPPSPAIVCDCAIYVPTVDGK